MIDSGSAATVITYVASITAVTSSRLYLRKQFKIIDPVVGEIENLTETLSRLNRFPFSWGWFSMGIGLALVAGGIRNYTPLRDASLDDILFRSLLLGGALDATWYLARRRLQRHGKTRAVCRVVLCAVAAAAGLIAA
ncbi:hypothetical protein [Streptomyces aureus]|uniref:hypothetical protein n=1 Tax=Streptomyces aureus TaxID=193461 RepID=UPI00131B0B79|nr:hypothetical protein [Streptomyces aureus]